MKQKQNEKVKSGKRGERNLVEGRKNFGAENENKTEREEWE